MTSGVLGQLGLVLLVCVGLGAVAVALRLPMLVGLLVAGVVVGPEVLGLVEATEEIELLGEIGISLLLFVVGLKLDPRLVRKLGPVVMLGGTIQVAATLAIASGLAVWLGMTSIPALYIGAAMSFSSTVVVIKLLTDRGEIEQLHGRISLGILIVQDIVVVALMIVLASVDPESTVSLGRQFGAVALRGLALFGGVALVARFVLPRVTHLLARRGELLILASVTWAVALAATAIVLGFSAEVGAFVAGVALASSDYREAISGRLATLRDFLLVFFFIDLGVHLRFEGTDDLTLIIVLSVFVLIGKPALIATITTVLGFSSRVGVRAALTLAQISEFSLILTALGVALGHIDGQAAGVVAAVALLTITASTLLSARAESLMPPLAGALRHLERARLRRDLRHAPRIEPTVIVIGLGRLGRTVAQQLRDHGHDVLGVDFDPRHAARETGGLPVTYGDSEDPELPSQLPLRRVRWVVSTPRNPESHRMLTAALRRNGYSGRIAVAVDHEEDVAVLEDVGVDLVVRPLEVAAGPLLDLLHGHDRDTQAPPETLG